ncbi:sensor domain-containing diguanylate cyclase [Desulfovibrio gilichinskyi]|uniref:PAS domain S-box-containing protein/diguanylate cyclase (GGDEF) domain-containing protein n=1 Tax=Desulfovibrio gilichinskyi TaxID=1519643 RepID=A0A1X7DHU1_9BACT|nr:diguanylate cyclase [Desulfovibrio gilichinskyi]SMF15689.1 PAS domain S-box-containing protein/diguanylate cyclase (GGDEF) domain-containing protein [Desulfovibrio gilichinskyi]
MSNKKDCKPFKKSIKKYLLVTVVILAVAVWAISTYAEQYLLRVSKHESELTMNSCKQFNSWFELGVQDVSILSDLLETSLNKDVPLSSKLNEVAAMFTVFGSQRNICIQMRFFSTEGVELVRVNFKNGVSDRVYGDFSQSEGNREHLQNVLSLKNEVHVSSLDLNIDHSKAAFPHAPVVKFLKKVSGQGKTELGMVEISYSGRSLVNLLKSYAKDSFGDIFLLNGSGHWVIGLDNNYNLKFIKLEQFLLFARQFSAELDNSSSSPTGQFLNSNGLYTYGSVYEDWKIISYVAPGKLVAPRIWITIFLFTILFLWSGFLLWRKSIASSEKECISNALQESEKRFLDITDAAGEFIWETGPEGNFIFVTGRAEDILGYSAEELVGRSPFDFVDEESSWEVRKEFLDAAQERRPFNSLVSTFVNRDGHKLWLEFNGVPVLDSEGNVTGFRGATSDITAQRKTLQELQDREDMLQSISDSVQDALILLDDKGLVHFWNPAAEKIFGFSSDEMIGRDLRSCVWAEDNPDNPEVSPVQGGNGKGFFASHGSFTVNVRKKDGSVFPAEVLLSPLRRDASWWVVGTIRDVTERKEAEDSLRKLATTDPLTGLSNRRFFMEKAEEEVEKAKRYNRSLSLLMLDIDFFKKVNDTYGHDAGDDVLKALSVVGLKVLRNVDVFGRIGGEEFSILMPDTDLDGAVLAAERIRSEIEKANMQTRSGILTITVSIGAATVNERINTLELLLKAADLGLYAAKDAGRNQVKVQLSPDMTD